tara:strand:+ start:34 stop:912 length:879 start_codon:yes stop_codon:yes gene_type:complete
MNKIVCFGEVLWDVFPNNKIIGGAPFNVAYRLNSLGMEASIISSIGNDSSGELLIKQIKKFEINTTNIQKHPSLKTGEVKIVINENGIATYQILSPVAWDEISITKSGFNEVKKSSAFVYGSLSSRNEHSKKTLLELLKNAKFKIFDLNLRPPHYSIDTIKLLTKNADLLKCNQEELLFLSKIYGYKKNDLKQIMIFLSEKTNTSTICVSRGENGAILYQNGDFFEHSGYKINVKDTVGAGDSFLAALIYFQMQNFSLEKSLKLACAMGALVSKFDGANPKISTNSLISLAK